MKVSNFFVEFSLPCYYSDIKIKHEMFPDIVKEVYGKDNPSGYINDVNEAKFDKIVASRYFFRYWLSKKEQESAYSRKSFFVKKKTPFEALIEDYFLEVNNDMTKQEIFKKLKDEEQKTVEIYDHYGETTTYNCVIIAK